MKLFSSYQEFILLNGDYYVSLINDINKANHTIDIEVYIFEEDAIGTKIAATLTEAAGRGVKIRVLVDGVGTPNWGGNMTQKMEEAGILTQVFHPFPWKIFSWLRSYSTASIRYKLIHLLSNINKRNHRKTCIIDNQIVYVGSANVSRCHIQKEQGGHGWRDTTIRLIGVDTKNIQYAFNRAWDYFSIHERIQKRIHDVFHRIDKNTLFRLNYSRHLRHLLNNDILKKIALAKRRVWITNAYFVPDHSFSKELVHAARRGVDVQIVLPCESDIFFMTLLMTTFYTYLLKNDIKIFEYLPSILHAKILIIDDWYSVGSSNINYRSLIHDLEVDVVIQSNDSKKALEKQFLEDVGQSKKVELENLKKLPLFKRIIGRLLLYIRYFF